MVVLINPRYLNDLFSDVQSRNATPRLGGFAGHDACHYVDTACRLEGRSGA
jgi:hypothetical protein